MHSFLIGNNCNGRGVILVLVTQQKFTPTEAIFVKRVHCLQRKDVCVTGQPLQEVCSEVEVCIW